MGSLGTQFLYCIFFLCLMYLSGSLDNIGQMLLIFFLLTTSVTISDIFNLDTYQYGNSYSKTIKINLCMSKEYTFFVQYVKIKITI